MTDTTLAHARILVVEDEYYLADDACKTLARLGAQVIGPVATASEASQVIATHAGIDGVLLDVNLRGEMAFDVADTLRQRGIPFALVTGYQSDALPDRFSDTPVLVKPVAPAQLSAVLQGLAMVAPTG